MSGGCHSDSSYVEISTDSWGAYCAAFSNTEDSCSYSFTTQSENDDSYTVSFGWCENADGSDPCTFEQHGSYADNNKYTTTAQIQNTFYKLNVPSIKIGCDNTFENCELYVGGGFMPASIVP